MRDKAVVGIITPVFNGEKTIQGCINSIIAQTFNNWIHIIINDGSTDETGNIISKYQNDPRYHIVDLKKNIGRGGVRNLGLQIIKKLDIPYMCMLDADDLYYSDKLEWQFKLMEENTDLSLLSCSLGYIDKQNDLIGVLEPFKVQQKINFSSYNNYLSVPHACSMIRMKDVGKIVFDENLKLGEDQDFMIRFLFNKNYIFVPKIGYLYNREDSLNYVKYKKSLYYKIKSYKTLPVSKSYYYKLIMMSLLKKVVVGFLFSINKQKIYLNRIGRPPTTDELLFHKSDFFGN